MISEFVAGGSEDHRLESQSRGLPADRSQRESYKPSYLPPVAPRTPPLPFELRDLHTITGPARAVRSVRLAGDSGDIARFSDLRSRTTTTVGLFEQLQSECVGQELDPQQIHAIALRYTVEELVARDYTLGYLVPIGEVSDEGEVTFFVALGRVGKIRLSEDGHFGARYFSVAQIKDRLRLREGDVFTYSRLYDGLYRLNMNQDLVVNTRISLDADGADRQRAADIHLDIQERAPVHGWLSFGNTGSKRTDEKRIATSLSCANLTRHFDTLSAHYVMGNGYDDYHAYTGSYTLPLGSTDAFSLRLFGGQSKSEPDINNLTEADGDENFHGAQLASQLVDTAVRRLSITFGRVWRHTHTKSMVGLTARRIERHTAPFDVTITYADKRPDRWRGRTSGRLSLVGNWTELGDTSFRSLPATFLRDKEYRLVRGTLSRSQGLMDNGLALSVRAEGQYTSDDLVASEQKGTGGLYSVRGYQEDEFLTDRGVEASLELLSPWTPKEWSQVLRLPTKDIRCRGLLFFDYGYVKDNAAYTGGKTEQEELQGAGWGFRVNLPRHLRIQFDYGWPLTSTANSNASGRAHFYVKAEF